MFCNALSASTQTQIVPRQPALVFHRLVQNGSFDFVSRVISKVTIVLSTYSPKSQSTSVDL